MILHHFFRAWAITGQDSTNEQFMLPRGLGEPVEQEAITAAATAAPGDALRAIEGAGAGEPARQEAGLPVQIAAMAGPGGLGYDPSPEMGIPSRRARPESEIVHTMLRRFVIERSGLFADTEHA